MTRVSFSLVSLFVGVLLAAQVAGLVPDRDAAVVDRRVAACEALAIQVSLAGDRPDPAGAEAFARAVAGRTPDLVSVGVWGPDGRLAVDVGGHAARAAEFPPGRSTPTHMQAAITRNGEPAGRVEVCYRPLPYSGSWQYVGGPLFPLLAFTAGAGFVAVWAYLRRAFRRADPAARRVVPDRVRKSFNLLTEGVLILDKDQRIVMANDGFAWATGLAPDAIQGRKAADLPWAPGPAPDQYPWAKAVREVAAQTGALLGVRGPAGRRTVSVNSTPLVADDGTLRGALATFDDLTPAESRNADLRRLNRRLARSRRKIAARNRAVRKAKEAADAANKAKGEFLANVSHEIRTPMNAILGMTEVVLETRLTADQRECVEVVGASAGALLGVINDLLDVSKIEAGKFALDPADFRLRQTVDDALQTVAVRAHAKGLEVVCDFAPDVPDGLVGDPVRVRQVLVNLVGNAIKFTDRGDVTVRARVRDRADGEVVVEFAVADTGVGVPADKLKAIFEPFTQADGSTTRKYGGTGLGLTISAHLAELMGGQVWAESEVGRGSTFFFTARFGVSPRADTDPDLPALPAGGNRAVLVADDHPGARAAAAALLADLGLEPTLAAGGAEAAAELARAAAAGAPYALALVDADMPGVDGFGVAAGAPAGCLVVLMVLSADLARTLDRCREAGGLAHVRKPVKKADLVKAVRRALDPAPADAAPAAPAPDVSAGLRGLRILVADDNAFNRKVALAKLGNKGHEVLAVGTAGEVLAALGAGRWDLLLTDIQMPDMDGFELTASIRHEELGTGRHLPIVAMTAHAMREDRDRCLAAGMDGYVAKPIRDDELWRAIRDAVPAGGSPPPPQAGPADPPHDPVVRLDPAAVLDRVGGSQDTLAELATVFRDDCAGLLADLDAGVLAGDPAKVRAAAHTLKGMVGFFAADAAVAAAVRLERLGDRGDLTEAGAAVAALKAEVRAVAAELSALTNVPLALP